MSGNEQFLGIVVDAQFQILDPRPEGTGAIRLTAIQMQMSVKPESKELDLSQYEGRAIMVQGHGGGGWIYEAQVTDQAGPILTAVVGRVFGQTDLAGLELPHGSTPGPEVPETGDSEKGRTAAEELLVQAREGLHQERTGLQILGRALPEQAKRRSDALQQAVSLIDQALAILCAGD